MSVLAALSEMTCCAGIGGGSVLTLPQVSELLTHLDSGACSEDLLYAMADVPRQPSPAEWDAMRAGESSSVPEPEPEPEPVAETPTSEPTPAPKTNAEEKPPAAEPGEGASTPV